MELRKKELKALLCDSRVEIIKSLKERRKTVTELSRELNLSKSTVHEHLTKLVETGFVERKRNRKWVYYELTDKGQRFLRSEFWKLIMLSIAMVTIVGGVWEVLKLAFAPIPKCVEYDIARTPGADYIHLVAGAILVSVGIILILYVLKRSVFTERSR
ncbi:winged helix-turn-helix domain-containing protein [Archaeoglobus sp.]